MNLNMNQSENGNEIENLANAEIGDEKSILASIQKSSLLEPAAAQLSYDGEESEFGRNSSNQQQVSLLSLQQ